MDKAALKSTASPPSSVLKEFFSKLQGIPSDEFVQDAAKTVMLPPEEVRIWLDHLHTVQENHRRGATKAAATRQAKKTTQVASTSAKRTAQVASTSADSRAPPLDPLDSRQYYCGKCNKEYEEETDEVEVWVGVTHVIGGIVPHVRD